MSREPHRLPPDGPTDRVSRCLTLVADGDHPRVTDFGWRLLRCPDNRRRIPPAAQAGADVPPLIARRISIWVAEALLEPEQMVDRRLQPVKKSGADPQPTWWLSQAGAPRQILALEAAASNDNPTPESVDRPDPVEPEVRS